MTNHSGKKEASVSDIRINKYLSDAGCCSRREADRLIQEERVTIDGKTASMGDRISKDQKVCVDGIPVVARDPKVLLLFHKPVGIVCSTKKQRQETTVIEYLNYPIRVYPVGRLDKDSEGLLLLTNEGELVNRMMKASEKHEKEYVVTVDKPIKESFLNTMRAGVPILDTVTRPCTVIQVDSNRFRIILTQGLNRQIRRMCEYCGYRVTKLKRIRIMNLTLEGLKSGQYRSINKQEWEQLQKMLSLPSTIQLKTGEQTNERKSKPHERTDSDFKSGRKSVLSGRPGNHEQLRVRPSVRRTGGTGKNNRNRSGR